MVAQPIMMPVAGFDAEAVAENTIAVWAVVTVLDSVPATPETQRAFEVARARLQRQIETTGMDTNQIDLAFAAAELPLFETRGDPPLGC